VGEGCFSETNPVGKPRSRREDVVLRGLRRLAADTELEDGSKVYRRLEEGDQGGHGLITGQIAIDKEEDIQYWYLLGKQNGENRNGAEGGEVKKEKISENRKQKRNTTVEMTNGDIKRGTNGII